MTKTTISLIILALFFSGCPGGFQGEFEKKEVVEISEHNLNYVFKANLAEVREAFSYDILFDNVENGYKFSFVSMRLVDENKNIITIKEKFASEERSDDNTNCYYSGEDINKINYHCYGGANRFEHDLVLDKKVKYHFEVRGYNTNFVEEDEKEDNTYKEIWLVYDKNSVSGYIEKEWKYIRIHESFTLE
jgi:hypothetical protein